LLLGEVIVAFSIQLEGRFSAVPMGAIGRQREYVPAFTHDLCAVAQHDGLQRVRQILLSVI
jgi:hypothetical protein